MKKLAYSISTLFSLTLGLQAAVNPGDIAFTLFDADSGPDEGTDQFAFVALNPIAGGEEIYFRDEEWNGTAFVGTSEDELLWTAPVGGVAAGTVVAFSELTVNIGTVTQTRGGTDGIAISGSGDDIWAFVGTSNIPTTFLAVISSENFSDVGPALTGTGLTAGTAFAIELEGNVDEAQYTGPRSGLTAIPDFANVIANVTLNWTQTGPASGNDLIADTTTFVTGGTLSTISLTIDPNTFSEDAGLAAAIGTITLPTLQAIDVTVTLSSSDLTEAVVPNTVIIPAGELTTTFNIDALDDLQDDGDRIVTLTAVPTQLVGTQSSLTVTDDADSPSTTLAIGDILFTCFNSDSDSFAFVAIADIPVGEIIYFTDEEWDDSIDAFGDEESDVEWTSPGISAGEVVVLTNVNELSVNVGSAITSGSTGVNSTTETIYAYQGPAARVPVTFLAAIANHTGDSIVNTGLTAGVDAFFLDDSADYGDYDAARFGQVSIADYAPLIADLATNWIQIIGEDNATTICNETDFTTNIPPTITIVDCGFAGDNFFIEVAEGAASFNVTSSDTLDFANATPVNASVDPNNSNRFLIPEAERNPLGDFFRVEL